MNRAGRHQELKYGSAAHLHHTSACPLHLLRAKHSAVTFRDKNPPRRDRLCRQGQSKLDLNEPEEGPFAALTSTPPPLISRLTSQQPRCSECAFSASRSLSNELPPVAKGLAGQENFGPFDRPRRGKPEHGSADGQNTASQNTASQNAARLTETERETHLPAEQTRSQAPPWLQKAHGNRRRPQRPVASSRQGPQASVGLTARHQPQVVLWPGRRSLAARFKYQSVNAQDSRRVPAYSRGQ